MVTGSGVDSMTALSSRCRRPSRSRSDTTYGYAEALADGVVRPVIFLAYSGETRWRTSAGDELAARLGEPMTQDLIAQAWRTALDPEGEWMPAVLDAANRRLSEVRRSVPDAGGLVIATDHFAARAYAEILKTVTGRMPTVVLSDEKAASDRIAAFAKSTGRWIVAVRMVSEGVDIPRLGVGVYATSASTPLYFAQAVGRFVRTRRRGETAASPAAGRLKALRGTPRPFSRAASSWPRQATIRSLRAKASTIWTATSGACFT